MNDVLVTFQSPVDEMQWKLILTPEQAHRLFTRIAADVDTLRSELIEESA